MKKTLIISGHPNLGRSTANRIILENLMDADNLTTCDIASEYPDGRIDVEAEQNKLLAADLVILQFPFIWYGMPSHMKAWLEKVCSFGFAFGAGGDKLKNKKLLLSITLGSNSEAYSERGQHRHPVETFLRPLELFVNYCGMEYLLPVYSYEMAASPGRMESVLEEKALQHAERVKRIIAAVQAPLPTVLLKNDGLLTA